MDKNNTINLGLREGLEYFSDKYTPKYACTVSERKTEWIYADTVGGMRHYRCSNCTDNNDETLATENEIKWWKFCPRCGAKTDLKG